MIKVASTSDIIRLLQEYEKSRGVGAVLGISTICQGDRETEYNIYLENKDGKDMVIEIPSVDLDSLWEVED